MCTPFDTFPPYKASQRHQFGSYFRGFGVVPRGRVFLDAAAPCQFVGRMVDALATLFQIFPTRSSFNAANIFSVLIFIPNLFFIFRYIVEKCRRIAVFLRRKSNFFCGVSWNPRKH